MNDDVINITVINNVDALYPHEAFDIALDMGNKGYRFIVHNQGKGNYLILSNHPIEGFTESDVHSIIFEDLGMEEGQVKEVYLDCGETVYLRNMGDDVNE